MTANSDAVRRISGMHSQGYGYHTIARTLNADRVPTASGQGQWHAASARAAITPGYWAAYQRQRRSAR
jgi:hypothetical protein